MAMNLVLRMLAVVPVAVLAATAPAQAEESSQIGGCNVGFFSWSCAWGDYATAAMECSFQCPEWTYFVCWVDGRMECRDYVE
jgi:hypothetical protein